MRSSSTRLADRPPLRLPGQDGQDSHDVVAELGHETREEARRRLVGALAVAEEDLGGEGDVGLGRGHLSGVGEAQHARRLCWATAVPIWPMEAPITAAGMW